VHRDLHIPLLEFTSCSRPPLTLRTLARYVVGVGHNRFGIRLSLVVDHDLNVVDYPTPLPDIRPDRIERITIVASGGRVASRLALTARKDSPKIARATIN